MCIYIYTPREVKSRQSVADIMAKQLNMSEEAWAVAAKPSAPVGWLMMIIDYRGL